MRHGEGSFSMEIPEGAEGGVYSNQAAVRHSNLEFILDFLRRVPEKERPLLVARVVVSPQHAKIFAQALSAQVRAYEEKFGEIKLPEISGPPPYGGELKM